MLKYYCVVDINSKKIILGTPKEEKLKFKEDIKKGVVSVKPKKMVMEARGNKAFPSGDQFFYQKLDENFLYCLVAENIEKEGDAYRFFGDFHEERKKVKEMKNNKDLDSWLKTEIKAFNSGERITKGEKINQRVKKMSKKIEKRISKELAKLEDLQGMNEDILEMEKDAKDMDDNARALYAEAWWYNNKMTILLWASTILMVGGGVFLVFGTSIF